MTCEMPGCERVAKKRWRTIPICNSCHGKLRKETLSFYDGRTKPENRRMYKQFKEVEAKAK
ncbi:hypothetical protein J42TS3_49570 [Paenibacillus vini]|uniref:GATA-type domain-containing protein n=1 Tax=Paenibacillus vini TaxID=1476024 RepID=A0ABQ4MIX7_9BACL|nr:hypothetical protein J42TS3_49570 [Paenibacillus vini]